MNIKNETRPFPGATDVKYRALTVNLTVTMLVDRGTHASARGIRWSLDIVVSDRLRRRRLVAGLCSLLNLIRIALMYDRGYWSSLGW